MNRLLFADRNLLMRFVAEALKRGGIGLALVPQGDGTTEVCFWDRVPS